MWRRGGIDRKKKNSTINLTSVNGACFWCLPQTSPLALDVTTNNFFFFFLQCSGEHPKYIWNNHNNYIIPRLTLLIETFIHTYHSFTVHFSKSINTVFHFLEKLSLTFLDTSFSWTLSFLLGPYFSSFSLGIFILLQFVGLHPTLTTRLISGRACLGVSTIKSAALMFPPPRVNLLVPVPAATYNTCSAHN